LFDRPRQLLVDHPSNSPADDHQRRMRRDIPRFPTARFFSAIRASVRTGRRLPFSAPRRNRRAKRALRLCISTAAPTSPQALSKLAHPHRRTPASDLNCPGSLSGSYFRASSAPPPRLTRWPPHLGYPLNNPEPLFPSQTLNTPPALATLHRLRSPRRFRERVRQCLTVALQISRKFINVPR
jgi:hypothetical protein